MNTRSIDSVSQVSSTNQETEKKLAPLLNERLVGHCPMALKNDIYYSLILCLLGMLFASLFAMFSYGLTGLDPAHTVDWIDFGFWTIIVVFTLPCAIQYTWMELTRALAWIRRHLPRRNPENIRECTGHWIQPRFRSSQRPV